MKRRPNYDLHPSVPVPGHVAFRGWPSVAAALGEALARLPGPRRVLALECYPGVDEEELIEGLGGLAFRGALPGAGADAIPHGAMPVRLVVRASEAFLDGERVEAMLRRDLTEDRVRGFMANWRMEEFLDKERLAALRARVEAVGEGLVLVVGTGASLVTEADLLVHCPLARWEIQGRYRRGLVPNWLASNRGEDSLRMYKRGFFVDWRVADRLKRRIFPRIDFILDTNRPGDPRLAGAAAWKAGLAKAAHGPFRLVPYFDPGPWGGQWMKRELGLDPDVPNYAWCFDCVPEENSLVLGFDGAELEVPALDLVHFETRALLGEKVESRFGAEFPIRFDFLDTMEGGNLSLQVHPDTDYIRERFGMAYTQDESYYLLDAGEGASVYLGLKSGTSPAALRGALESAQRGEGDFDAERLVNRLPARKHDHFLIPAGTVHCSGRNAMVLEISATPFIFTFKLWDWGRLGMDGRPRPIHLEDGLAVIDFGRNEAEIARRHVNRVERIAEGEGWIEERTGLHEAEFIETRRHWFTAPVRHDTGGTVNVLNLVEGEEVTVESPCGAFPPFVVHYAETFILPAAAGAYMIRPSGPSLGARCATIKAYVRG